MLSHAASASRICKSVLRKYSWAFGNCQHLNKVERPITVEWKYEKLHLLNDLIVVYHDLWWHKEWRQETLIIAGNMAGVTAGFLQRLIVRRLLQFGGLLAHSEVWPAEQTPIKTLEDCNWSQVICKQDWISWNFSLTEVIWLCSETQSIWMWNWISCFNLWLILIDSLSTTINQYFFLSIQWQYC